jgi:hypothetical protein
MNIFAFVVALISAGIVIAGFKLASRQERRWLRACLQALAFVLGFGAIILISAALNVDLTVTSTIGSYWFYIMLVYVILSKVLKRKKKAS